MKYGKWKFEKKSIGSGYWIKKDSAFAQILAEVDPCADDAAACARLIAAAPELLLALKQALREIGWEPRDRDKQGIADQKVVRENCLAAIAKAEGV